MTTLTGRDRVDAHARSLALPIELIETAPATSLAEAAANIGVDPSHVIKSIVVRHRDGSHLFALIPGDRQISWPLLRATVGTNKLSMPDPDQARDATGYTRGTITPLGSTTPWPVYADASMRGRRVALGGGEHHVHMLVDADALLTALDATVADITEAAR